MNSHYLYHICLPEDVGKFEQGYIGITKDFESRIKQHKRYKWFMNLEDVTWYIIEEGSRDYVSNRERELRPNVKMGWNLGIGGCSHATRPAYPENTLHKICPVCKIEFSCFKSIDSKTCSAKCGSLLHKVDRARECKICNCIFEYKHNKQICCSRKCGQIHSGRLNEEKPCESCGQPFKPKRKTTKVCSKECLCKLRSDNANRRYHECI